MGLCVRSSQEHGVAIAIPLSIHLLPRVHLKLNHDSCHQRQGCGFNSSDDSYFVSPDTSWKIVLRKMYVLFTLKLDIHS